MDPIVAYIDPGTGATLTQLVLAGSVGVAAVVKLKWHSIKSVFNRKNPDTLTDADDSIDEEDPVDHR